jgi:uncharacterized membrane protein YccF (DUF307 family)
MVGTVAHDYGLNSQVSTTAALNSLKALVAIARRGRSLAKKEPKIEQFEWVLCFYGIWLHCIFLTDTVVLLVVVAGIPANLLRISLSCC